MPRSLIASMLGVLLLSATGCATMSESQCRFADWHELGQRDARDGRPAAYFAERAEACREHGLTADHEAYRAGWQHGLDGFCTPDGGFRHGVEGSDYRDTCPPGRERAFLAGYGLGMDLHRAQQRLERLEGEIVSLESELGELEEGEGEEARRLERELQDRRHALRVTERELGRLEATAVERGFVPGRY